MFSLEQQLEEGWQAMSPVSVLHLINELLLLYSREPQGSVDPLSASKVALKALALCKTNTDLDNSKRWALRVLQCMKGKFV